PARRKILVQHALPIWSVSRGVAVVTGVNLGPGETEKITTAIIPIPRVPQRYLQAILQYVSAAGTLTIGMGFQFVAYIVLARSLGVDQFGKMLIILAGSNMAYFVCGLGAGDTIIRQVARDKQAYPFYFGHALILIASSAALLLVVVPIVLA